jgi:site-specific recombinase XerD
MTTPLRERYIRDLAIRGRAERTQQSYSRYVSELARYYHRSPELISYQEVADWLYHLIKERHLSASSVNIAVNAVRFLYGITLERNTEALMASVPRMKHAIPRAEIYARRELEALLSAPRQPRDRAFLMTVYACGLRLSEATQLKTTDIDRARMQLRVRQAKGGKERVLPLSPRLLKELEDWRPTGGRSVKVNGARRSRGSFWLTKPDPSAPPAARTSITGRSKRAACAAKAAFIPYGTVLPPT